MKRLFAAALALAGLVAPAGAATTVTLSGGWQSLAAAGAVAGACVTISTNDGSGIVQAATGGGAPAASDIGRTVNFFAPYAASLSATLWVKGPAGALVGVDTGMCNGGASAASGGGPVALIDRSGTTSATPGTWTSPFATNTGRQFARVTNTSTAVLYVWDKSGTPAQAAAVPLQPGQAYVWDSKVGSAAIQVMSNTASMAFEAAEG